MKRIYLLFLLLVSSITFGQTPIITAIVDGDCSGGTPKMLEIYANGTVDFSLYALENQTNANTTWGSNTPLSTFGIVTDDFVYISTVADLTILNQEFPSTIGKQVLVSSVINLNGDDRIRIVQGASVIDQFGVSGVDGTGTTWETADSYAKRIDGTGPDFGFVESNWNIPGAATLDLQGICQGGTAFETLMGGIGTFSPTTSTTPSITITSPSEGAFLPPTPTVNVSLNVSNFNVANPSAGDGFIKYTVDGGAAVDKFDTANIALTLSAGAHTVTVELVDNSGASLSPAATDVVNFTIASLVSIPDIATLRQQPQGSNNFYQLTGEAIVTFAVAQRNQKYIQDATAGILIDDASGVITSAYVQQDGITGLKGTLSTFNGVLQFLPFEDPGAPSSIGNTIAVRTVNFADFNINFDSFESQVVKLQGVTIVDPLGSATFTAPTTPGSSIGATNYDVNDGTNNTVLRTQHAESNLNGVTIPTVSVDLIAIAAEFGGASQLIPFYDFVNNPPPALLSIDDFSLNTNALRIYPNPVSGGVVNIVSAANFSKDVEVFDLLGKSVLQATGIVSELNVAPLRSGVYLLKITEDGQTQTRKLVIKN